MWRGGWRKMPGVQRSTAALFAFAHCAAGFAARRFCTR
jgi:hypothetical protein